MFQILTLPAWHTPMPAAYCVRGESYWSCVELPAGDNQLFVLNLDADPSRKLPIRTVAVASGTALLSTIANVGNEVVRSIYLLSRTSDDLLSLDQVTTVTVGVDPEDRWRRAYRVVMESGLEMSVPSRPAADRMIDRTVMTFVGALEPADEVEESR
jgi:hypothetical protein